MKKWMLLALFASPMAWAQNPVIDQAAAEKGAVKTESGMVYRSLKDGSGASPKETDVVSVHYRGTLPDGKEFDSSIKRGQPTEFPLNRVIKCWTEGVQKMKVGGKAKLTCPPNVAYGERGTPGGPDPAERDFDLRGRAAGHQEVSSARVRRVPASRRGVPAFATRRRARPLRSAAD